MFRIWSIPWIAEEERFDDEGFRDFLVNKRVERYHEVFFQVGEKPCWSVFVEYHTLTAAKTEGLPAEIDGFSPIEKQLYEQLREWRAQEAKEKGIPPYGVATNRHLVEIIKKRCSTLQSLSEIPSFGGKRVSQYGKEILHLIKLAFESEEERSGS